MLTATHVHKVARLMAQTDMSGCEPSPASAGSAFRREYLGMPMQETDAERKLRELAEEYHRRTEAYDRTICTGAIKRGTIMPATGWEASQINRNAIGVRDTLEVEAVKLGFTAQQWRDAIRRAVNTPNDPSSATATKAGADRKGDNGKS